MRIGCSSLHACRRVPKEYKSGMINSWNKFCYTGGFIEAAVQLPGNAETSGFWVRGCGCGVLHLVSPNVSPAADQMFGTCSPALQLTQALPPSLQRSRPFG